MGWERHRNDCVLEHEETSHGYEGETFDIVIRNSADKDLLESAPDLRTAVVELLDELEEREM